jgi:hypothetical protein
VPRLRVARGQHTRREVKEEERARGRPQGLRNRWSNAKAETVARA